MAALIQTLETWPKQSATRPVVAIHTEKYVLKSAIFKLADGVLEVLGLTKRKGGDVFFVEPDREKLAEVSDV